MDLEEWTEKAVEVYCELEAAGMNPGDAAGVTKVVLREFGRDHRDRDVNAAADSSWRGKPVTENQKEALLATEDYTLDDIEDLTRGEASDILDQYFG